MHLRDYWAVVKKRWWLFVLLVGVTGLSAYGYSKAQQPIFRSTAKLYIMPSRPDLGLTIAGQNLVRQYSQLLGSDRFLNKVSQELRLDLTAEALREKLSANGTADNLAVQLEVDDPDPLTAQRIAKALAQAFILDQQLRMANVDLRDKIDVAMYDDPQPGQYHRPQTRVNVAAGAVLGLVLAAVFAFFLEYLDDTIKGAEDVERYLGVDVVGSIPNIPAEASLVRRNRLAAALARLGIPAGGQAHLGGRG